MRDTLHEVLPAEGLTWQITCRTGESSRTRHDVTLTADWQLETPHDLDVERIGVALGGTLTCVTLADRLIPAARDFLEHETRARPAAIVGLGPVDWRALVPASGCACDEHHWPSAALAADHVRSIEHWVRAHGVRRASLERLVDDLMAAGADTLARVPRRPDGDRLLVEPFAVEELWAAGVPPALVPALCRELSPTGLPIPTRVLIAHVFAPQEWGLLEPFVAHGPDVLAWAANRRTPRDARQPGDRLAWVEAGVGLATIDRIFTGQAYSLVDARAYASATGVSLAVASGVLGRWQDSGTTPSLRELVDLHRDVPDVATSPGCAPALRAIERAVGLAARRGYPVSAPHAALAIARAGNVPDAVAALTTGSPTIVMEVPR